MPHRKPNRFRELQRALQLTTKAFAARLSFPAKQVRRVLKGRCPVPLELLASIRKAFRQVNLDWLLLGEGEIFTHPTHHCPAPVGNLVAGNSGTVTQHITYVTCPCHISTTKEFPRVL